MAKEKVTLYLEPDKKTWLESKTNPELKIFGVVRNIIRDKMNVESRRKAKQLNTTSDPFNLPTINAALIPDDLKQYSDLLIEWWPIRKQKGGVNSTKVANRIFDTLRSFPSQDRKEALEKAISNGWKDIFPLKKGYKPEEPKNNHPAARIFTARGGFE